MTRTFRTCAAFLVAFISTVRSPARASETSAEGQSVPWWTPPGETDMTAFAALFLLFLLLFAVFHFYARFDRFAEHHNEGTPLQTTIPTLLMIAFAYEIFPPLSHFSILLPLALIATALARDLMLWFEPMKEHTLKGELEGVLLEELQHKHLGEHDRDGRRVQPEPVEKPVSVAAPDRPAQAVRAEAASQKSSSTKKKTPAQAATQAGGGGSDRD